MIHYLVDVSWLLYRGFFAMQHVYSEFAELHYLCKKLGSLLAREDSRVHLCLDGANPKGRRLLKEDYKSGRKQEGGYNVYAGLSSFIHLLNNDRIKVYYNNDYESDEIIFTLSRTLEGRKKILSGDKDLLQSLNKDTVIESFKGLITTEESYKAEYADKFFEIEPRKLPIFRAIAGDASDTLKPPVIRFPRKLAARIVSLLDYNGECPSIEQLKNISLNFNDSEKKWVDKLIDAYKLFSTNFDIMKLNVITDPLHCDYQYPEVELGDFLKSKIEYLNTL
jgi:5'-3' exonuclease